MSDTLTTLQSRFTREVAPIEIERFTRQCGQPYESNHRGACRRCGVEPLPHLKAEVLALLSSLPPSPEPGTCETCRHQARPDLPSWCNKWKAYRPTGLTSCALHEPAPKEPQP